MISNGVINLCADKAAVFAEAYRVLRPGGVLQFADIANGKPLPEAAVCEIDLWTGCIAGGLPVDDWCAAIEGAGFDDVSVGLAVDAFGGSGGETQRPRPTTSPPTSSWPPSRLMSATGRASAVSPTTPDAVLRRRDRHRPAADVERRDEGRHRPARDASTRAPTGSSSSMCSGRRWHSRSTVEELDTNVSPVRLPIPDRRRQPVGRALDVGGHRRSRREPGDGVVVAAPGHVLASRAARSGSGAASWPAPRSPPRSLR